MSVSFSQKGITVAQKQEILFKRQEALFRMQKIKDNRDYLTLKIQAIFLALLGLISLSPFGAYFSIALKECLFVMIIMGGWIFRTIIYYFKPIKETGLEQI